MKLNSGQRTFNLIHQMCSGALVSSWFHSACWRVKLVKLQAMPLSLLRAPAGSNEITENGVKFMLQLPRTATGHSEELLARKKHGQGKSLR